MLQLKLSGLNVKLNLWLMKRFRDKQVESGGVITEAVPARSSPGQTGQPVV